MPYCHRCGALLDEHAHFCHTCGAPVLTFAPPAPAPPPPRPLRKDPLILFAVVAVSVLVVVVILLAALASPLFSVNFNQTNPDNYNINSLSLNFSAGNAPSIRFSAVPYAFLAQPTPVKVTCINETSDGQHKRRLPLINLSQLKKRPVASP